MKSFFYFFIFLNLIYFGNIFTSRFAFSSPRDPINILYLSECSVCHGQDLSGTSIGPALVGVNLKHGESIEELANITREGIAEKGMPSWGQVLSKEKINALALFVSERRNGLDLSDFKYDIPLKISNKIIKSELHNFYLEVIVRNLDPLPFSISPLPNGNILVTEKMKGLRIISKNGNKSDYIKGLPKFYDDSKNFGGQSFGLGWIMDVALHPNYKKNGWVYIHYGDRCLNCNIYSKEYNKPVSMNKLIRGRIKNRIWVDQEEIWSVKKDSYTNFPEIAAGGRITFDQKGHVYISVGAKGENEYDGIQDLTKPYGKIHRVYESGNIPTDNPFYNNSNFLSSIWSYGHRNPQGLEYNFKKEELWSTEMGPRGGDELNLIIKGGNFGWPLYSKGVKYNGSPLSYAYDAKINFSYQDITQPIIDFTPSPALSSFIFYKGKIFSKWKENLIVGTLRGTDLLRIVFKSDKSYYIEKIIENFARIRDIEEDYYGNILIN
jgi:glucose/arabinose dehydrogenase